MRYNEIVSETVLSTPITPSVIDLLNQLSYMNIDCCVLSGGDTDEVKNYIKHHSLQDFFVAIKAGSKNKKENMKELFVDFSEILFIGDSITAKRLAEEFRLDFFYVWLYWLRKLGNIN